MIGLINTFFGCKNIFQNNVFWLEKCCLSQVCVVGAILNKSRFLCGIIKLNGVIGCRTAHFYTLIKTKGKEYE